MISPIFKSTRLCYSLWYNAPTMLPAGNLDAEEFRVQVTVRRCNIVHIICISDARSSKYQL